MPLEYDNDFTSYGSRPEFDFFGAGRGAALSPASGLASSQPAGSEFLSSGTPSFVSPGQPIDGDGDAGEDGSGPAGGAPSGTGGFSGIGNSISSAISDPANVAGTLSGFALGPIGNVAGRAVGNAISFNNAEFGNNFGINNISVPEAALNSITMGLMGDSVASQNEANEAAVAEAVTDEAVSFGQTPGQVAGEEGGSGGVAGAPGSGIGDHGDTATGEESDDDAGDGGGDGTVICTALHSRNMFDSRDYFEASSYGEELFRADPDFMFGYQKFAKPFVWMVRKSRLCACLIRPFMVHAVRHLSRRDSLFGAVIIMALSPLFRKLGARHRKK